ncbi:MAG: hypothetical protein LBF51_09360 [Zoogloeaceae bacterium]|jgi:hypothetical protein|nr:hypothetical protein [Zoogloeaceae bacterium]
MRKQYHFRNSGDGLWAWDVNKLIQLTANLEPVEIPLGAITELDEPYWREHEGDMQTCRSIAEHMRLIQVADLSCPIIVCPAGRIMDGMHRVVKAFLEGHSVIRAFRLPVLPKPDFIGVDPDDLPYSEK